MKKIYKYYSLNKNTLDCLKTSSLFFASASSYNDPFEYLINLPMNDLDFNTDLEVASKHDRTDKSGNKIYNGFLTKSGKEKMIQCFMKDVQIKNKDILHKRGVCCFSKKNDNMLMWAHYAQEHKGICLEFDMKYEPFKEAYKINYSKRLPVAIFDDTRRLDLDATAKVMLTTKSIDWKYECEYRLIYKEANKLHKYDSNALTAVYFGCRCELQNKKKIISLLKSRQKNIRYFSMLLDPTFFELFPNEIE